MTDMFSPQRRSEIMSHIRSKETEAERIVFRELRRHKVYFQKHYSRAPGKPDIALPRKRRAVFIDGDFWHGRHLERIQSSRLPDDYWVKKLAYNMRRDKQQMVELIDSGWKVLRIWESDIKRKKTRDSQIDKIVAFLTD